MKNLTRLFGNAFIPTMGFTIRSHYTDKNQFYVESHTFDNRGRPINVHPLSTAEAESLAKALTTEKEKKASRPFLQSEGLLPAQVLHLSSGHQAGAIWHTPAQVKPLLFVESLGIKSGEAPVPALLWKATRDALTMFALTSDQRPDAATELYHAPFFNLDEHGSVCLGTIKLDFAGDISLDAFINTWETAFFNSYFSHLYSNHNPVKENIVAMWAGLIEQYSPIRPQAFPIQKLQAAATPLHSLLPNL